MTTPILSIPRKLTTVRGDLPDELRFVRRAVDRPRCCVCARDVRSDTLGGFSLAFYDDAPGDLFCSLRCAEFADTHAPTLIYQPNGYADRSVIERAVGVGYGRASVSPLPALFAGELWSPIGTVRVLTGPERKRFAIELRGFTKKPGEPAPTVRLGEINGEHSLGWALVDMPNPYTATAEQIDRLSAFKLKRFIEIARFATESGRDSFGADIPREIDALAMTPFDMREMNNLHNACNALDFAIEAAR